MTEQKRFSSSAGIKNRFNGAALLVIWTAVPLLAQEPYENLLRSKNYYLELVALLIFLLGLAGLLSRLLESRKRTVKLTGRGKVVVSGRPLEEIDRTAPAAGRRPARAELLKQERRETILERLPKTSRIFARKPPQPDTTQPPENVPVGLTPPEALFAKLPIARMPGTRSAAAPVGELPFAHDPELRNALEIVFSDFGRDEEVRTVAVNVIAAFRAGNAVRALSLIAISDQSVKLRARAVAALGRLNHESVFGMLLRAATDSAAEVRAAAGQAYAQMTIDRAAAWTRILGSNHPAVIRRAARAAGQLRPLEEWLQRLAGPDEDAACEALAALTLMIKAGESEPIRKTSEQIRSPFVRMAFPRLLEIARRSGAGLPGG